MAPPNSQVAFAVKAVVEERYEIIGIGPIAVNPSN